MTAPRKTRFSPKAKGWAACVAVGAAATVASVSSPQKAHAYGWWTPASGQALTWGATGYPGETRNLNLYNAPNPIVNNTGNAILTQTGSTGSNNLGGIFTYDIYSTEPTELTTAPYFAYQSLAGFSLMNTGYDGANLTGTSSAWWMKVSFIDRQNADNTWPAIGIESWDTWNRYFFVGAGYAKQGGANWVTESGTDITAGPWGGAGYTQNSAPTSSFAEQGLITMFGDGTNDTVSLQTTSGQNNASNAGAVDMGIPYANRVARVNGADASVRIGKLEDGTIEITWEYDGVTYPTYQNTFWTGTNDLSLDFIAMGYRYAEGAVTFTDFEFGGGYTTQVPEPASLGLLGIGGMLVLARRRKA